MAKLNSATKFLFFPSTEVCDMEEGTVGPNNQKNPLYKFFILGIVIKFSFSWLKIGMLAKWIF